MINYKCKYIINNSTVSINNLISTSNKIFNSLNNLSEQSFVLTYYTKNSKLNVSGATKLNGVTSCIGTLMFLILH